MRSIGEAQVVEAADRLVANTDDEAAQLVDLYGADPERVRVVSPGVDLDRFTAGDRALARDRVGLPADAVVLMFVGRIQPLKAPDMLVRAAAEMVAADPSLRERLLSPSSVVPAVPASRTPRASTPWPAPSASATSSASTHR